MTNTSIDCAKFAARNFKDTEDRNGYVHLKGTSALGDEVVLRVPTDLFTKEAMNLLEPVWDSVVATCNGELAQMQQRVSEAARSAATSFHAFSRVVKSTVGASVSRNLNQSLPVTSATSSNGSWSQAAPEPTVEM